MSNRFARVQDDELRVLVGDLDTACSVLEATLREADPLTSSETGGIASIVRNAADYLHALRERRHENGGAHDRTQAFDRSGR